MARWTQRSYWLVVGGAGERFGLTLEESREFYRRFASYLGDADYRPGYQAYGVDLDYHPRIASAVAQSIVDEREEEEPREWEVTVRYPRKKKHGGGSLMVQVRVTAPASATRAEVERVALSVIRAERRVPEGYRFEGIDWESVKGLKTSRGAAFGDDMFDAIRAMRFALRMAGLEGMEET